MSPSVSIDVGFEKGACCECAAGATASVFEVGIVAFDLVAVAFENGQMPRDFASAVAGLMNGLDEVVVVAH